MALTDSLISFWELEEASGTRVDAVTASANDLTANNTPGSAAGKVGTALSCTRDVPYNSATVEFLSRADNASLSVGDIDFTICCWVNHTNVTAQGDADLLGEAYVGKWNNTSNQRAYLLTLNITDHAPNNRFTFNVSNDGTAVTVLDHSTGPSASTWYFVVAWHDATANTINLQINDGTAENTAHTTGVFDNTAPFRIGCLEVAGINYYPMAGLIDQVGFWKRTLTAAERTWLYNTGSGRTYAAILAEGGGVTTEYVGPIYAQGFGKMVGRSYV